MAWSGNVKYRLEFDDLHLNEWRIDIAEDGYAGGVATVIGSGAPVMLSWEAEKGGDMGALMIDAFHPSSLEFSILTQSEFEWVEFFDASYGTYRCQVILDPSGVNETKWTGFNVADTYTEPFVEQSINPGIKLKFDDGLKRLREIRWDAAGVIHTGNKHLIEILRLALNLLPDQLNIVEAVNVYDDDHNFTTTDSPLTQTFILSEFYKMTTDEAEEPKEEAMMARDVVECILVSLGCRIFQRDNKWHIVRHEELRDASLDTREFVPDVGSESNTATIATANISHRKTIDNNSTIVWMQANADLEIYSAIEKVIINYKGQNLQLEDNSLVRNPDFRDWGDTETIAPTLYLWSTGSGIDETTYPSRAWAGSAGNPHPTSWPDPEGPYAFVFQESDIQTLTIRDGNKFIQNTTDNIPLTSTDKFELAFACANNMTAPGFDASTWLSLTNILRAYWQMQVKLTPSGGGTSIFLKGDLDVDGETFLTPLSWETTTELLTIRRRWSAFINTEDSNKSVGLGNFPVIRSITTPAFTGSTGLFDLEYRIFAPQTNFSWVASVFGKSTTEGVAIDIHDAFVSHLHMIYLPDGGDPIKEKEFVKEIDDDADILQFDICHSDGPSGASLASFRLSSTEITDIWNRRANPNADPLLSEDKGITTILIDSIERNRAEYRQVLSGRLNKAILEFDYLNTLRSIVTTDSGTDTRDYAFLSLRWDIKGGEADVKIIELAESTTTATSTGSVGGSVTTIGGGGDPEPVGEPSSRSFGPFDPLAAEFFPT